MQEPPDGPGHLRYPPIPAYVVDPRVSSPAERSPREWTQNLVPFLLGAAVTVTVALLLLGGALQSRAQSVLSAGDEAIGEIAVERERFAQSFQEHEARLAELSIAAAQLAASTDATAAQLTAITQKHSVLHELLADRGLVESASQLLSLLRDPQSAPLLASATAIRDTAAQVQRQQDFALFALEQNDKPAWATQGHFVGRVLVKWRALDQEHETAWVPPHQVRYTISRSEESTPHHYSALNFMTPTTDLHYWDTTAVPGVRYLYLIMAQQEGGKRESLGAIGRPVGWAR